jgi:hypothetical protein
LQATKHITSKGKATRTALALSVNFSRANMESNLKSPHGKIVGILLDNGGVAAFDFVEQEGGSIYKLNGEFESSPKAVVFRILCHFFILCKTEMTHDQTNLRYGSRTASPA